MLRNYLKSAIRNLLKHRLYSAINVLGLAAGITGCILIGIYIWHELSYDKFHKNADRLVRVNWNYKFGEEETATAFTGTKVGPELKRRFPEVESFTRILKYTTVVSRERNMFEEEDFLFADSTFFTLFSFSLKAGNLSTVLNSPDKIVISESAASKYFGDENPLGQRLKAGNREFVVSGVAADAPLNSQISFDFVASFNSLNASKVEKYYEANYFTYLLLASNTDLPKLGKKISDYSRNEIAKELQLEAGNFVDYTLQPLKRIHLHSDLAGLGPAGSITNILILAAVAVLILIIACVNYTNLSVALSAGRNAEVGLRKVLGAGRAQLFLQFIAESVIVTAIALLLAITFAALLLPYFNDLSGKQLPPSVLLQPGTLAFLFLMTVIISISAGFYPALVLSGGKLINTLRSGFSFTGSGNLRRTLVVAQFTISIFLIISTAVVLQQLKYVQQKDLGYDKEQLIILPVDNTMRPNYEALKQALASHPAIGSIGGAYEEPSDINWSDGITTGVNGNEVLSVTALPVDIDLVSTLKLQIVAGSDFTPADLKGIDTSNQSANLRYSYMLNQTAAQKLGWSPEEAIGKTISKGTPGEVKAVVADFHFHSLHESIGPLVIFLDPRMVNRIFVKLNGNTEQAIAHLESVWKARVPHRPFEFHFLDEEYDAMYRVEQRTAGLFSAFSLLAVFLACLGLFALTAFTMVKRSKEFGIRKVMGATTVHILRLVSRDFLVMVVIAFVIAIPLSWIALQKWLGNFSYRINIPWWIFLVAGLATLALALITILIQAVRQAGLKPANTLRSE